MTTTTKTTLKKGDAALYNGKKFRVLFAGETRFGARARLCWFSDESKAFWVDLSKVEPAPKGKVAKAKPAPAVPTFLFADSDGQPVGWASYREAAAEAEIEAEDRRYWRKVEADWAGWADREYENRGEEW